MPKCESTASGMSVDDFAIYGSFKNFCDFASFKQGTPLIGLDRPLIYKKLDLCVL